MTLTKIAMTKRGRVALYADGAFVMSLHPDVFAASGISVGSQIDEDALRELSDAAELREARERALSMLSRQDYTARGLRDRLTRHVSEEAAGQAVERMQELGLIDDERYAARFAQELLERRHYGAARIRQELRRRPPLWRKMIRRRIFWRCWKKNIRRRPGTKPSGGAPGARCCALGTALPMCGARSTRSAVGAADLMTIDDII